jgi:hypothetical protein
VVGEELLELEQAGRPEFARFPPTGTRAVGSDGPAHLVPGLDGLLDRSDGELLGHGSAGERLLEGAVGSAEKGAGVPGRELAFADELLYGRGELEQPQRVGDGRSAAPDPGGESLVGEPEVLDELLVGGGFLERVEVFPVEVLDQGLLEAGQLGAVSDDGRDGRQSSPAGGAPAALAGDELVAVVGELADQDRLEDAQFADRRSEGGQGLLVEVAAGLMGVRVDRGDRDLEEGR